MDATYRQNTSDGFIQFKFCRGPLFSFRATALELGSSVDAQICIAPPVLPEGVDDAFGLSSELLARLVADMFRRSYDTAKG